MKLRILIAGVLSITAAGLMLAAASSDRPGMVVHEWGTFLAMNGSDGVSLDGMYHEEHGLPGFVHARSSDQLKLKSVIVKGETPVIYFYAERPERVSVRVDFPGGIWTQWYPQASLVGPSLAQVGTPPQPRNGHISWSVLVTPPAYTHGEPPLTSRDALWNHARDVDASYVSTVDQTRPRSDEQWERFIFYRGLGEAKLPIEMSVNRGQVRMRAADDDMRHVFVVRVEHGRGTYSYIPTVPHGTAIEAAVPDMSSSMPLDAFADAIGADVALRLVASGLYEKEARAMVNTWRSSYSKSDGLRVLVILPQAWTDRYIPLRIEPVPRQTVRVMVGRVELLTRERERRAETAISDLASPDAAVRETAFAVLREEGRYVESIVRRTLRTSKDPQVQLLCRRLLLTDFVTELRSGLRHVATGEKVPHNPLYARAQLASLLREIGLDVEAKQEGEAALLELERMPPPEMKNHDSRHLYRALARAHEGAGHDREALRWYGEFVRFASQLNRCSTCHDVEGPRTMAAYRDWWAGRKFAEYAVKTGEAPKLIAMHASAMAAKPSDPAAGMSLAYLYDATGQAKDAEAVWDRIAPTPQLAAR